MGKRILALAVATVGCATSFSAIAGVSEDLIFCSKIASDKGKLACFEAIARKDKLPVRAGAQRQPSAQVAALANTPSAEMASNQLVIAATGSFAGAYVFGGAGSYFATRDNDLNVVTQPNYYFASPDTTLNLPDARGAFGHFGIGYNATSGNLLAGGELRATYGGSRDRSYVNSIYDQSQYPRIAGTCGGSSFCFNPVPSYSVTEKQTVTAFEKIGKGWGADAALRVGYTHGDWLIFGKVGGGADEVKSNYRSSVETVTCTSPSFLSTKSGSIPIYTDANWMCCSGDK